MLSLAGGGWESTGALDGWVVFQGCSLLGSCLPEGRVGSGWWR